MDLISKIVDLAEKIEISADRYSKLADDLSYEDELNEGRLQEIALGLDILCSRAVDLGYAADELSDIAGLVEALRQGKVSAADADRMITEIEAELPPETSWMGLLQRIHHELVEKRRRRRAKP